MKKRFTLFVALFATFTLNLHAVSYEDFLGAIASATFEYSQNSPNGVFYYLTMKEGYELSFDYYCFVDENGQYVLDESDVEVSGQTTTIFFSVADDPVLDKAGLDFSYMTVYLNGEAVDWDSSDYLYFTRRVIDDPTGVQEVQLGVKAQKIIRNGQVYIQRGKQIFDLTGGEVK